jgi:hypothetical protein
MGSGHLADAELIHKAHPGLHLRVCVSVCVCVCVCVQVCVGVWVCT